MATRVYAIDSAEVANGVEITHAEEVAYERRIAAELATSGITGVRVIVTHDAALFDALPDRQEAPDLWAAVNRAYDAWVAAGGR